jgi:hypothetical protein
MVLPILRNSTALSIEIGICILSLYVMHGLSKSHPKDNRDAGEVINRDYRDLLEAVESEDPGEFENLTLGLGRKLTNPQAGFAYDLEGPDAQDTSIRPAPKIDSPEAAGEMAEVYWMALCRDVPFGMFNVDNTVGEAVTDLSTNYSDFPHSPFSTPVININRDTIFREQQQVI